MQYIIVNGEARSTKDFDLNDFLNQTCIYEVIRIIDGIPLFWEDHLKRLENSLNETAIYTKSIIDDITTDTQLFFKKNKIKRGSLNIFLLANSNKRVVYWKEGRYPNEQQYRHGVNCGTLKRERLDPQKKVSNTSVRKSANKIIANTEIVEVLLLNENNKYTEGSKSNLFFIDRNVVYTAPEQYVLKGITRQYVITAIQEAGLEVREQLVSETEAMTMEGAFLTGTSPKILPIATINGRYYSTDQIKLREIMKRFDTMLTHYTEKKKQMWTT